MAAIASAAVSRIVIFARFGMAEPLPGGARPGGPRAALIPTAGWYPPEAPAASRDGLQDRIRFINEGIGGDVVTGLRDRWGDDVLAHEPGWVSVLVGINDLHRTLRGDPTAVPPSLYRQAYTHCLRRTAEETSARLILMDPFYMCAAGDADDFQRRALELLSEYTGIVAELAGQFDAAHVRLHEMFQRVLRHYPADFIGPEPVHPNATGHLMIAHEWLHALQW